MKGKKLLTGLLSAAMVLGSVAVPVFADVDLVISTAKELENFAADVNGGNTYAGKKVQLTDNIDLSEYDNWESIGKKNKAVFSGEFDGNGKTISNLNLDVTGGQVGLFGKTTGDKTYIHDFTIDGVQAKFGFKNANHGSGAVIGEAFTGKMENVHVKNAKIESSATYTGGLIGHGYMDITDCSFEGTIDCTAPQVGGIAGSGGFTITHCTVIGSIHGDTWVGGIVGNCQDGGAYSDCYVKGEVSANYAYAGVSAAGIAAIPLYTSQVIEDCYNDADIKCDGESIPCPIIGGYNDKVDSGTDLKLTGNSWNRDLCDIDSFPIIGEGGNINNPVKSASRNNNMVVNKSDIKYVGDLENAVIKNFTNVTSEVTQDDLNDGAVAEINTKKYSTLAAAMNAAQDGDTINILADITFDKVDGNYGKALINVTKDDNFNLTINGNGHKISTGVVLSQIDAQGAPYVPSISIKSNGGSLIVDNVVMPENLKFNIYGTEAVPADSLTIQNCTMNGSILDYMEATKNITYDNNNFAVNKNQYKTKDNVYPVWYKMQNKAAVESFTFTNNKVDFPRGIQLSHLPENMKIKVTGNTFDIHNEIREKNSALMIGAGQSADKQFKGKVVFSQNTVTAENGSALCIYSPSDNNTGFDFEAKSNIVAGGAKLVGYNIWSYSNTAEKEAAETLVNKVLKNVNGSENYADTIDIKFKPTSDERVYDIVLSGESKNINRFNAAEFTFSLDTTDKITYEIAAAEKMSLIPDHKNNKYEFHFDGKDDGVADTATEIKIGSVAFDGFGTFAFSATAGKVTATTVADNLVTEFVTVAETGKGTLKISEDTNKIPGTTISVPQHKLTINIAMNHKVTDNVTAYQDMTVEISGGNLGTNTKKYELGTGGKQLVNGVYTIKENLDENGLYTVTVKGAGYRTARYTVALTEDKTMNFWNNVMTDKTIVVDDVEAKTNFLAGDIIKDGTINIYDLSAVVAYFNADKTMDTTKYEKLAKYDLNRDGKIDMMDISIVLTSWNN